MLACILGLLAAGASQASTAADESLRFYRLPLSGALVQNTVTDILQDRNGLLWFGTLGGLNVYDGYEFREVSAEPRDNSSLSGPTIGRLFEDRDGFIWVAGQLGWLDRIDPRSGAIRHFSSALYGPADAALAGNTDFLQGVDGILWIGNAHGLHRYDPAADQITLQADAGPGREALRSITALAPAANGELWVGTARGLYRFDPASGDVRSYRHDASDPRSISSNAINELYVDRHGVLWIGTMRGLNRMRDGNDGGFERFMHVRDDPDSLGGDIVLSILLDQQERLWVGTQSGGLSLYRDGRFQVFRHHPDDPESLPVDDVWSLFQDRSGLLWVGTAGGGLAQVNPLRHRFETLRPVPYNTNSLRSGFVWDIAEDESGLVWFATLAGLERFDPVSRRFTLFEPTPGSLAPNQLQALHIADKGSLWVGGVDGSLYRFDSKTEEFVSVPDPSRPGGRFSNARVWHVAKSLQPGELWVSTMTELVAVREDDGAIVGRLKELGGVPISGNPVRTWLRDSDDALWIGSGAGLFRYQRGRGVTDVIRHQADNPLSLSQDSVRSLYESSDGSLWVGTHNGLNRMTAEDRRQGRNRFTLFSTANGLANNTIYGLLPDPAGGLWLSTNAGLSLLDPSDGSVRNFDWRDGLSANEMNGGAELIASDGTIYFGSVAGAVRFKPRQIPSNDSVPPVHITGVTIGGETVGSAMSPASDIVELHPNQGSLTLRFAVADYHAPEKNRFRYRLSGDSGDWIETASNRVELVRPAPGSYVFEVLGSNNDGLWSEQPARLSIIVHPPWWRTPWAYALYVLSVGLIVLTYHRQHRQQLLREREYNEQLSKAQSLAEANYQLAERHAQIDNLTQLPNRASLLDALARYLRFTRSKGVPLALLVINLDRFQRINDTLGHAAGDRVLQGTAERLQAAIRGDDWLARTGSDEFALISVGQAHDSNATWLDVIAARLSAAVSQPHDIQNPPVRMSASIGICLHEPGVDSPADLYTRSDIAMHLAKQSGGNCARRYQAGMREQQRERLGLESRMRDALDRGEFQAYYQPLIDLQSGELAGFEALVRWLPPNQAPIFPDQFIPIAEESGLIVDIGDWMINQVCAQLAQWGRDDIKIAVNISMRHLKNGDLLGSIRSALQRHAVEPSGLKIEITESAMMENAADSAVQLAAVRELGVSVSIDDFGTGFSSLSHLQMLPVDEMKIDRSFVIDLSNAENSRKIVRSIVRLAHELKLRVVAEGIEDEAAVAFLRALGCDLGQGYLFDKPLPASQVTRWLEGYRVDLSVLASLAARH